VNLQSRAKVSPLRLTRRNLLRLAGGGIAAAGAIEIATRVGGHQEVFSVTDHGARGDGVSNDQPAAQAAYEAAVAAGGGTVRFPPGKTYFMNTARVPSAIRLEPDEHRTRGTIAFSGYGATVKLSANTRQFIGVPRRAPYETFRNIRIEGFRVDADHVGGVSKKGFWGGALASIYGPRINISNIQIRDCETVNVPSSADASLIASSINIGTGKASSDARQNRVTGVTIERCRGYGGDAFIQVNAGSSTGGVWAWFDDIVIRDCHHDVGLLMPSGASSSYHSPSWGYGGRILVENCYSRGTGDVAVEIDAYMNATVRNCLVEEGSGPSFLATNYQYPASDNGRVPSAADNAVSRQQITFENCRCVNRQANRLATGLPGFQARCSESIPMGNVVFRGCAYQRRPLSPAAGLSNEVLGFGGPGRIESVTVDSFDIDIAGLVVPAGHDRQGLNAIVTGPPIIPGVPAASTPGTVRRIALRDVRARLHAQVASNELEFSIVAIGYAGGAFPEVVIDGVTADVAITGSGAPTSVVSALVIGGSGERGLSRPSMGGVDVSHITLARWTSRVLARPNAWAPIKVGDRHELTIVGKVHVGSCDCSALKARSGQPQVLRYNGPLSSPSPGVPDGKLSIDAVTGP
jgi:hypothetical protein